MSSQSYRLPQGGGIDRSKPLRFRFNGRALHGYRGDTLASALLANGVRLLGRSFKYHRPRGVFAAGIEETSALVRVGAGGRATPNLRATQVELRDGLLAASQHCWPSVGFDLGALTGLLAPVLPAGFYYKTFMWPATAWMFYERFIRRAAGLGKAPTGADPDRYSHRHTHCDVLVVGAGPAGLAAAQAAANAGARVILADEGPVPGGGLLADGDDVDGLPGSDWAAQTCAALTTRANVRVLSRATAFGYYDDNLVGICERLTDHHDAPDGYLPRERLWLARAGQVVLATGAIERPLVFANNDRPGVMLACAVRRYVNEYAVRPGSVAVVFTNNDSAYRTAVDLHRAGVLVRAVVDSREEAVAGDHPARMRALGIECLNGHVVSATLGRRHLRGVEVAGIDPMGRHCIGGTRPIPCDLLCVSGGWSPTVHLFSQSGGRLRFDEQLAAFVPAASRQQEVSTGACRGLFGLAQCLADGERAGSEAAAATGHNAGEPQQAPACGSTEGDYNLRPLWLVPSSVTGRHGKRFVDLQNDVTADDVGLAVREGYSHVEHLKRYTTLGMGTDQGRTSNVNGLAILAELRDTVVPDVGTTTFRAPYGPVTLGALVGPERGRHLAPTRRSPMHHWHEAAGATFVTAGQWLRASCYPRPGESVANATGREARAVRRNVGIVDVSTLGKIDVQGADAAEFLERIYVNRWHTLKPGRIRYGLMLREDGMVFDDGTCTRLVAGRFFMTTTTAHAAQVLMHLERYAQTVWPDLEVHLTSTTDHWAAMAVAGPNSRAVLAAAVAGLDLSDEAFPHLAFGTGRVGDAPVRLFRMSYSGELAYEVHTPADWGLHVWERVMQAGRTMDITPYGTEAMNVLRIEKGHIVIGAEIDGRTTPDDLGMGALVKREPWFVGQRLLQRAALQAPERKKLVGLKAVDGSSEIPAGAQLVAAPYRNPPVPMLGHVTSSTYSVEHERPIALGLLAGGLAAHKNDILFAASPLTGQTVGVRVTPPVFVDPDGERPRG